MILFNRIIPSMIVAMASLSMAQVPVSISENISTYMAKSRNGEVHFHRSGLLKDTRENKEIFNDGDAVRKFPPGFDEPESPVLADQKWKGVEPVYEYDIGEKNTGSGMKKFLENEWTETGLSWDKDNEDSLAVLSAPKDSVSEYSIPHSLPLDTLKEMGLALASKHLKAFHGRIEFENFEVGYLNDEIANLRIRFRRIFKGGIIRKDLSYVYLKLDGRGTLKEIRIKWPKFKKIEKPLRSAQENDILAEATRKISGTSPISNTETVLLPKHATLLGVARGWYPVEVNGKLRLSPCYSYSGEVEFESGKVMNQVVDVPQAEQYFK